MQAYLDAGSVQQGAFQIYAMHYFANFDKALPINFFERVFQAIENKLILLQVIVNGSTASQNDIRKRLQRLSDFATQYQQSFAVYLHLDAHLPRHIPP